MVIELIKNIVFCINNFVYLKGILLISSPISIVECIVLDFNLHFHLIYSKFIQTDKGIRNNMSPRTINTIVLELDGNLQGGITCLA